MTKRSGLRLNRSIEACRSLPRTPPSSRSNVYLIDDASSKFSTLQRPSPRWFAHEMEDTSPAPTPRIGIDRSGTASPRSMLSDDAASAHSARYMGGRSPGSPQPPVSAVRSEFSQNGASPVSNFGWDQNHSNIRNTIRDAALLGYGQQPQHTLTEIAELDGDTHSQISEGRSPFADRHATRTP